MLKFDYEFNGNELKRESVFRDQKAAEDLLSSESFSIIKSSVEKAECSFEYKIQSGWFLQFSHTRVF